MLGKLQRFTHGQFDFMINRDGRSDPLWGVEIWVWFRREPCCDADGHQYRLYLPLGVKDTTVKDCCVAFCKARHCSDFSQYSGLTDHQPEEAIANANRLL